jgi:hypothetical protein
MDARQALDRVEGAADAAEAAATRLQQKTERADLDAAGDRARDVAHGARQAVDDLKDDLQENDSDAAVAAKVAQAAAAVEAELQEMAAELEGAAAEGDGGGAPASASASAAALLPGKSVLVRQASRKSTEQAVQELRLLAQVGMRRRHVLCPLPPGRSPQAATLRSHSPAPPLSVSRTPTLPLRAEEGRAQLLRRPRGRAAVGAVGGGLPADREVGGAGGARAQPVGAGGRGVGRGRRGHIPLEPPPQGGAQPARECWRRPARLFGAGAGAARPHCSFRRGPRSSVLVAAPATAHRHFARGRPPHLPPTRCLPQLAMIPGAKGIQQLLHHLPSWLSFRETEKVEWLNAVLAKAW